MQHREFAHWIGVSERGVVLLTVQGRPVCDFAGLVQAPLGARASSTSTATRVSGNSGECDDYSADLGRCAAMKRCTETHPAGYSCW